MCIRDSAYGERRRVGGGSLGCRGGRRLMQVALLFPGQGAQTPGFLRRLPEHAAVGATLDEARQVLGVNLDELDGAAALASTAAVQLGTVIAGVATARACLLYTSRCV